MVTDFSLADSHQYILDRSHVAACRLNLQHFLWREALQFNIHPSIKLSSTPRIADVAAGTGLWLVDVASQHPDARLHGFDIDLTQAPHEAWLSSANISLEKWDIFQDPPPEWHGKFDFVHVRLLVLVLTGHDAQIERFITNLLALLKPGGYLQWDELNCVNMHVRHAEPVIAAPALDRLKDLYYANGCHDWVQGLVTRLASAGFERARMESYGDSALLARAFNDQHLLTMEEFGAGLIRIGKSDAADEVFQLIRQAYKESVCGAALCIPRVVCTAKRPNQVA